MQRQYARACCGFTLVELLIVIAIIGILAAVAYPNYIDYVQKTRRSDGQLALLQAIQSLERCKASNYSYSACTLSASDSTSPEGHYALTLSDITATTFKVTATAQGAQARDVDCKVLTINQQGSRTPAASLACWPN